MRKPFNRDYGGINPHEVADVGVPKVTGELCDQECPNCGCSKLFTLEVQLDLKGDGGALLGNLMNAGALKGTYLGCPACPWASQMAMVATKTPAGDVK